MNTVGKEETEKEGRRKGEKGAREGKRRKTRAFERQRNVVMKRRGKKE